MNQTQYQKINPIQLATFFVNKYHGKYFLSSDIFTNEANKKIMLISKENINKIASAINDAIVKKLNIDNTQTILLNEIHHTKTLTYLQYVAKVKVYENKCHTDFLVRQGTYTCFIF